MCDTICTLSFYNTKARKAFAAEVEYSELLKRLRKDKKSIFVAIVDGKIVGVMTTVADNSLLWLDWMIVGKAYRNKEIGSSLMEYVLRFAKLTGVKKVWGDSRTSNSAAIHVLRKLGFSAVCTLEKHWYGQDYIIWEKFT